jgi:hypothetical protein
VKQLPESAKPDASTVTVQGGSSKSGVLNVTVPPTPPVLDTVAWKSHPVTPSGMNPNKKNSVQDWAVKANVVSVCVGATVIGAVVIATEGAKLEDDGGL